MKMWMWSVLIVLTAGLTVRAETQPADHAGAASSSQVISDAVPTAQPAPDRSKKLWEYTQACLKDRRTNDGSSGTKDLLREYLQQQ